MCACQMRLGSLLILVEKPETLAKDKIGKERLERSLARICPEGKEEKNGDESPGPEKGLQVVKLKQGTDDGDGRDGKRIIPVTTKERVNGIGGSDVDVGARYGDMLLAVEEEAEAPTDGRAHAHVNGNGVDADLLMQARKQVRKQTQKGSRMEEERVTVVVVVVVVVVGRSDRHGSWNRSE